MGFAIVRSNSGGCEPRCQEWIFAGRKIMAGTPSLFKKALAKAENRHLPVMIRSDGGDALAAMAMGHLIRAQKLDIIVAITLFAGCSVHKSDCRSAADKSGRYRGAVISNKDACNSACALVLAAGLKRLVELRSVVAVHPLVPEMKPDADFREGLGKYFDEMGVDRELLALMEKAPVFSLYNLSHEKLIRPRLMTARVPIEKLALNGTRQSSSVADNCIRQ